ncbi:gypsy type transposase [Tanacetum coccineum]
MAYCLALVLMARAFFASTGSVPSVRYSNNGVIHEYPSSSTTARIFLSSIDFSFRTITMTCLVKWAKLVDAILLRTSAFFFLLLGTCLIENFLKLLISVLAFSRPAIKASYSDSLLDASNLNLNAHEDPSVKRIHGSRISSYVAIFVDGSSSSGRSAIKSRQYLFDWLIRHNCAAKEIDWHFLRVSFRFWLDAFLAAQSEIALSHAILHGFIKGKDFPEMIKKYAYACYWLVGGSSFGASATILHSAGIIVLMCSVTIPSFSRNLIIPWAVDGTAWIFMRPGRPMIPLYGDGDRTTIKFIRALVECSSSPRDAINDICPNGQDISSLNPRSRVVAGVIRLFTSGQSLLKQCSYKTSEADPPSIYMRWMR